MFKLKLMDYGV